jgi:hypothetical protein
MLLEKLRELTGSPEEVAEATRVWKSLEHRSAKLHPTQEDLWECINLYRAALTEMRGICLARKLAAMRKKTPEELGIWRRLQKIADNCLKHCA